MELSGTSVAAPVVSGAVALMLQANPGLTPPLVKAILQYTAQPLPGANLLQQGAGLLNVEGAVRLAAGAAHRHRPGDRGRHAARRATRCWRAARRCRRRSRRSTARRFNWGRLVVAGGNHLLSGDALFTQVPADLRPDAHLDAPARAAQHACATGRYTNTVPRAIDEARLAGNQRLVTGGVLWVNTAVPRSAPTQRPVHRHADARRATPPTAARSC